MRHIHGSVSVAWAARMDQSAQDSSNRSFTQWRPYAAASPEVAVPAATPAAFAGLKTSSAPF